MAFIKKYQTFLSENKWTEHFEAEFERDIADLPDCVPGSTCRVLESGNTYEVGNNGYWCLPSSLQADWNQNDPAAADYVKNRPCYIGLDNITWDGDTTGKTVVADMFYRVSNYIWPSLDFFIPAIITVTGDKVRVSDDMVLRGENYLIIDIVVVTSEANVTIQGVTFPMSGVYFAKTSDMVVTGLSIGVQKMDSTYLPDGLFPYLVVNLTSNGENEKGEPIYTPDVTWDEATAAIEKGTFVFAIYESGANYVIAYINHSDPYYIRFKVMRSYDSSACWSWERFSNTITETYHNNVILASSTSGSTKKFEITVDDTGTISATEVT